MTTYFSDEKNGQPPRNTIELPENVIKGIFATVDRYINKEYLAELSPSSCDNCGVFSGTIRDLIFNKLFAEIPNLKWNDYEQSKNTTYDVFDMIIFFGEHISKPTLDYNLKCKRNHIIGFNKEEGFREFRDEINTIFKRNGIAYELNEDKQIEEGS